MSTKPLYLYDSYLKEFEAKIQHVTANQIILDQTAFHPRTGGGHIYDTGYLTKGNMRYKVVKVEIDEETKDIIHMLEEEADLNEGDLIKGTVDWERRYRLMRLHTTAHLIAAIMSRDYNALITGGRIDYDHAELDFNLPKASREIFEAAFEKANKEASKNIPLKTYFLTREKVLKMQLSEYGRKLAAKMSPEEKELRIVEIPGIAVQTDRAPHLKNTKEIGEILLLKVEDKEKNERRVYFDVK